jgi:two-component system NtrC family sensor kinase
LEKKLRQLERLANLGTLAATMAHEIKNALVAVKTFSDLLLEQNRDAELSNLVRREIGRIDAIVSRMLRFSGPARAAVSAISLHESLEHALRLVQPRLESKSIGLERSFAAAQDRIEGNDTQIQQAFINLFLNALEAMPAKGTLTVATQCVPADTLPAILQDSAQRPCICVTIQDTGTGIPPEDLPRLFEPFFTTKPNGTGLGLLITRRIVLEHQGDISVQSRPGWGTAFRIVLPAVAGRTP